MIKASKSSEEIRPFTISIDPYTLDDLQRRLDMARLPEAQSVADWSQGLPLHVAMDFLDHWRSDYDWRRCERALNQYPGFVTRIDGLDVHFLHIQSPHPQVRPLLITHGWPGSILEFTKIIAPLTRPEQFGGSAKDAFHLILPSLPGYGFSGKPQATGWDIAQIASTWDQLMNRLGYDRYFAQGGDWGSLVTLEIARQNRGNCQAIHSNMVLAAPNLSEPPTEREQQMLDRLQWYQQHDNGYAMIQRTRPQTIGYALADSPVGQMAWILEKYYHWSDCNGDLLNLYSRDELLDQVCFYWLSHSGASSARLYWEGFARPDFSPISLPMGGSIFAKELFQVSRRWAEQRFANIIFWREHDRGGHFAAFEQPQLFIEDVRACFAAANL